MRFLLILLCIHALCSCGAVHTRTSLSNVQVLMEYQAEAAQQLGSSEEMLTAGPKVKAFVEQMGAIGQAVPAAIKPAQDTLDNQSRLLPWGKTDRVQPDISIGGLQSDFSGEIARVKFRSAMAQEESDRGFFATVVRNMGNHSWSVWLFGIASTLLTGGSGLAVITRIRTRIKTLLEESTINKEVAKNAIHYGKDMEQIALNSGDATVNRKDIERAIDERRNKSMLDQHKKGLSSTMDKLHGEVKTERK